MLRTLALRALRAAIIAATVLAYTLPRAWRLA